MVALVGVRYVRPVGSLLKLKTSLSYCKRVVIARRGSRKVSPPRIKIGLDSLDLEVANSIECWQKPEFDVVGECFSYLGRGKNKGQRKVRCSGKRGPRYCAERGLAWPDRIRVHGCHWRNPFLRPLLCRYFE